MAKAPGKNERVGLSLLELLNRSPNDEVAEKWLEEVRWNNGRHCPRCGSFLTSDIFPSRKN